MIAKGMISGMDMRIYPGALSGTVKAPPSKSAAHRALICAALAKGASRIGNMGSNDDIMATAEAVRALGADIKAVGDDVMATGLGGAPERAVIDCGESGSLLRFLAPVAAALGVNASFYGRGKLPHRPMSPLTEVLEKHGVRIGGGNGEILTLSGKLMSGRFELPGNISSQYITGLLFALPLLAGDSEIILTTPLESAGYVDITLSALERFGIEVKKRPEGYSVRGGQCYKSCNMEVEGDYSSAAFWLAAGAINSNTGVSGLLADSLQGDRRIIEALKGFGASVKESGCVVSASPPPCPAKTSERKIIDVSDIPDLLPVLAVVAAYADGVTEFTGAGRLRIKESDRLSAISAGLRALGGEVLEYRDSLVVKGRGRLSGGVADSFADHRIAMAMSIAALGCDGGTVILGAECVSKSYPGFFDDFKTLGGKCDAVRMG